MAKWRIGGTVAYSGNNFEGGSRLPCKGEFSNFRRRVFENLKKYLKKIAKMHYFQPICKIFQFSHVWTKNTTGREFFEKILKIFDENSIEKLNFYLFFGKVVAKNRAFGNIIIFLQKNFPALNPPPLAQATEKERSKLGKYL